MKLWDKGVSPDKFVIEFTSGKDRETDINLAGWDITGSMAHVLMLRKVNLISEEDKKLLMDGLHDLFLRYLDGQMKVEEGVEDIHSQVEMDLTRLHGDAGKKIHTGRSRNDQVLVDIRLFTRAEIDSVADSIYGLFKSLQTMSVKHKDVMLPGYTHLQPAMVSTFGMWFGGYAEALTDDLVILDAARSINNRNPLGTAAGYGSTLPIDRLYTTGLLEFEELVYNSSYASMNRGKVEMAVAGAMASVANTLSKLAMDACLFMSAEFKFIGFPDEMVTGSSIMPQKKNPDVFEIIRAKSNSLMALPNQIAMLINNLSSGYNRDLQLLKEYIFQGFHELKGCLEIARFMIDRIIIRNDIIDSPAYNYIFSTDEVNRLVRDGVPFREAYRIVAGKLKAGAFTPTSLSEYTHHGSIGNLCSEEINERAERIIDRFNSISVSELEKKLMNIA